MKLFLFICSFATTLSQSLSAQVLSNKQSKIISTHLVNIEADDSYRNANWQPVLNAIGDKRIVLIGEFNHGSKEVFLSRNELIRELHEKLGFDLILFESGLGELEVVNLNMPKWKPIELTQGFFGPWRTKEFEELMKYIQKKEIEITGFDVQRTGNTFTDYFADQTQSMVFADVEKEFVELKTRLSNYRTVYDTIKTPTLKLIQLYQDIKDSLKISDRFSKQTIENRIKFLTYMLDFSKTKNWNKRWEERDRAMADNVKWILSNHEPNQKAIVIAHNFHISKYNEKENVMGEFLKTDYENEMYVIGTFAGNGTFLNNSGNVEALSPPSENGLDVKHIVGVNQGKLTFLNITDRLAEIAPWLQKPIIVNDTFIDLFNSNELILERCFDGIILLDTITPAEKQSSYTH